MTRKQELLRAMFRYIVPLLILASPFSNHFGLAQVTSGRRLPEAQPLSLGMNGSKLARMDDAIETAIKKRLLPGAVVLISRKGKVAYRKTYGHRSLQPKRHKMTVDTLFDLASLTKPIVTAACIMILLERGLLRLRDPVYRYLPAFHRKTQRKITIKHLLLHTSGLIPDNSIRDYQQGTEKAWQRLLEQEPRTEPGSKFRYSDVGYIILGKIVEKVSGESLDAFARKNVFAPLGMNDTSYRLSASQIKRTAPTEKRNGKWIRGQVHDPRAHLLGGVAGHAGLFSTADDLAVYCQMLLNRGQFDRKQVLSPAAVRLMTRPQKIPGGLRSLGWDVDTGYSSNRGELFPVGGFGHTGFTGTSIWIDPPSQTVVIFLSNRVHPEGKGNVIRLRNQVATIVAASIVDVSVK